MYFLNGDKIAPPAVYFYFLLEKIHIVNIFFKFYNLLVKKTQAFVLFV